MVHRVTSVLLAVAVVAAAGTLPSSHVPPRNQRVRVMVRSAGRSLCTEARVHLHSYIPGTTILVGDRHHHPSVALAPIDAHSSVRVGATPALVGFVMAGIVPDLPGQPVPVAADTRPNRQPRIVLAARAPPA